MLLYNYFRSSAAYRTRIALNLKGLPYDSEAVVKLSGDVEEELSAVVAALPTAS